MTTFGKVALVTGGAGGIGILICSEILKNKFVEVIRDELIIPSYLMNKKKRFFLQKITILDTQETEIFEKNFDIELNESVLYIKTNVADSASVEAAYKKTLSVFGRLDIVINAAAIFNDKKISETIDINVVSL